MGASGADSLWDKLADLAIPDDEVENYAEALEAGRRHLCLPRHLDHGR